VGDFAELPDLKFVGIVLVVADADTVVDAQDCIVHVVVAVVADTVVGARDGNVPEFVGRLADVRHVRAKYVAENAHQTVENSVQAQFGKLPGSGIEDTDDVVQVDTAPVVVAADTVVEVHDGFVLVALVADTVVDVQYDFALGAVIVDDRVVDALDGLLLLVLSVADTVVEAHDDIDLVAAVADIPDDIDSAVVVSR